jgi:hypothetical protein
MRKTILTILAAVTAGTLALAGSALGRSTATPPTLKGTVGPGYTIHLTKGGKKVTSLKAGKYKFVVSDKASIHDFTLEKEKGAGHFEKHITGVGFTGTKTMTVKLTKGSWRTYCSVHESQMHQDFKVK